MIKPVAFVIPWYGESLKGGAEQFAWQFSRRLAQRGHPVEVLTTCCASFLDDWNHNSHHPGTECLDKNLLVRRFEVTRRNAPRFHEANQDLLAIPREELQLGRSYVPEDVAETFVKENIRSKELVEFVRSNVEDYQAFVYIPYMYGPTFDCLELTKHKAYLHPCLHDEVYAYLPQVESLFRQTRGILYNSSGEERLAATLYGPGVYDKGSVVGGGVESNAGQELNYMDQVAGIALDEQRYFLYLGRRDATKNTQFLVDAFKNYRLTCSGERFSLLLAGPGDRCFTDATFGISDLGLVSELEKESLIKHCVALLQPSSNESYSRSIMEAWLYKKPVVVHRDCIATAEAVEQSAGGWLASGTGEWVETFARLAELSPEALADWGAGGWAYARRYASWDAALDNYEEALGLARKPVATPGEAGRAFGKIVQLTAGIAHGDAISNQAIFIRDHLRQLGYASEIYCEVLDPLSAGEARLFTDECLADADALIYHHSIGTLLSAKSAAFTGPKALIYHNITPSAYFAPYNPEVAQLLEQGRQELVLCIDSFHCCYGDSLFNSRELQAMGVAEVGVLPIAVSPALWEQAPCPAVRQSLADGKRNILFVGRISPNKCQAQLVRAFGYYHMLDPNSRLILVGGFDPQDGYCQHVQKTIELLGLSADVIISGKVSQEKLHAYYSGSDLFWSMSEHEGFGVPLVESMWFEIPVMAYSSTAVPETLKQGGILFDNNQDLRFLAMLAISLLRDNTLRTQVVAGQRERRLDFHPDSIRHLVDRMIGDLASHRGR